MTRCLSWENSYGWKSRSSSLWDTKRIHSCGQGEYFWGKTLKFRLFSRGSFVNKTREEPRVATSHNHQPPYFSEHISVHVRLGIPCNNQYLVLFSSLRELLVVTGGYSWNSILARTEALNMTAEEGNRWKRLAPLLKPRYLHACSPIQLGTEVPFGEAQEL